MLRAIPKPAFQVTLPLRRGPLLDLDDERLKDVALIAARNTVINEGRVTEAGLKDYRIEQHVARWPERGEAMVFTRFLPWAR